jgi:pyrroloquinoline quinone biosynthesis protein B
VTGDGENWVLLNASPDLPAQLRATPALQPRALRHCPIAAVVLSGAEVDQVTGLLSLREGHRFQLYGTPEVLQSVFANPLFGALASPAVLREPMPAERWFQLPGGLEARLFPVPGKVPLYLEGSSADAKGFTMGVELRAGGKALLFVPGAAAVDADLRARAAAADLLLFDGTCYVEDELIRAGVGSKTSGRMGHLPIAGKGGSLAAFDGVAARRIYIHINNTNPILIDDSAERTAVEGTGWLVAHDGMEIAL